jgi:dephospho-CoA kinase
MKNIIAIVGMCGSGKSIASDYFENKGYKKIYLGGITMDKLKEENLEVNPENEKTMRERLRKEYGMGAYALLSIPKIEEHIKTNNVVLDGLYSWDELKILKEKYPNIIIISIVVDKKNRYERLTKREIRPLTNEEAQKRDISEIENLAKGGPIAFADYFILNNNNMEDYIEKLEEIEKELNK